MITVSSATEASAFQQVVSVVYHTDADMKYNDLPEISKYLFPTVF